MHILILLHCTQAGLEVYVLAGYSTTSLGTHQQWFVYHCNLPNRPVLSLQGTLVSWTRVSKWVERGKVGLEDQPEEEDVCDKVSLWKKINPEKLQVANSWVWLPGLHTTTRSAVPPPFGDQNRKKGPYWGQVVTPLWGFIFQCVKDTASIPHLVKSASQVAHGQDPACSNCA